MLAVILVRAVGGLDAFVSAVRAHSFGGAAHLANMPAASSGGTLSDYLHDPRRITVSLAELLIMLTAAALVAPDAARAQTASPAPPRYPHKMAA